MPGMVLGPLLRYVDEEQASVWVEADAPCEVEVLGRTARTFCVCGHHYAIVCLEDRPAWVVGHRIDDRLRVSAATVEVLEIRAFPLESRTAADGPGDHA